jgi:hypothetical protein
MKKITLILVLLFSFVKINAQTTVPYVEVNMGFSSGIIPFFPGASVLYGATTKYESGILLDYQGGIAFPSLITGKFGIGCNIDKSELTVGIRPWPASTYAQIKLNRDNKNSDIIISVEKMWSREIFIQDAIFTIGWRFDNKKYKDIRHK